MSNVTAGLTWKTIVPNEPNSDWSHSGMAVNHAGLLVYASLGGDSLIFHDLASGETSRIPIGTSDAHGILRDGERMLVADIGPGHDGGQVISVDSAGLVQIAATAPAVYLDLAGPWKPTSIALLEVPSSDTRDLWVADGYGQSLVHRFSNSGEVLTLDGSESGLKFDCPHGVAIDTRGDQNQVVVADRGNRRLVFLTPEGKFMRTVTHPLMTSPSSIAVWQDQLVITDLFGAILGLRGQDDIFPIAASASDQTRPGWPNTLLSERLVSPALVDGIPNSPHGIAVSSDDKIYFTEWLIGGRVVQLSPDA